MTSAKKHNYYCGKNAESIIPILKSWADKNFAPAEINASRLGIQPHTVVVRLQAGLHWLVDNTHDDPKTNEYWRGIQRRMRTRTKGNIIWLLPNDLELAISIRPLPAEAEKDIAQSFEDWIRSGPKDNERWPGDSLGFVLTTDQLNYFRRRQQELDAAGEYYMSTIEPDKLIFVKISKYTYESLKNYEPPQ